MISPMSIKSLVLFGLLLSGVVPASAAERFTLRIANTGDAPVLGMMLEAYEPGSEKGFSYIPAPVNRPLMPGETLVLSFPIDAGLIARGGRQQVRWYWSSGRECSAHTVLGTRPGEGSVGTGPRQCKDGIVPSPQGMGLSARLLEAQGIGQRGDIQASVYEHNAVMAVYGRQPAILHSRADMYARAGYFSLALPEFVAEAEVNPDRAHHFADLSGLAAREKKFPEALSQIDRALEISPGQVKYVLSRAQLLCQMGQVARAIEAEKYALGLGGYVKQPCASGG